MDYKSIKKHWSKHEVNNYEQGYFTGLDGYIGSVPQPYRNDPHTKSLWKAGQRDGLTERGRRKKLRGGSFIQLEMF